MLSDELRFGPQRTLNLRESLPTVAEAVARAESWLRQQQVERAPEVLIITGRGNQSDDGVSPVRLAVERLLYALRRRGVVAAFQEHTPGSFAVTPAPVTALVEAPRRRRDRRVPRDPADPAALEALEPATRKLLRTLAELALSELGVQEPAPFLQGEMVRQFSALAAGVAPGPDRETRLRAAIRAAIDHYDRSR